MIRKRLISLNIASATLILISAFFALLTLRRNILWKDGLKIWQEAVSVAPGSFNNHYSLGLYYSLRGYYEEAIKEYELALALNPYHAPSHTSLGVALSQKGLWDLAESQHRQAISIDPQLAEPHNNLGLVHLHNNRPDEAIENFKEALKINPFFLEGYTNAGLCYRKLGRTEDALSAYKKAIQIEPRFSMAYNNIGVIYADRGNFQEASRWFTEAARISFREKGSLLARQNLERLIERGYGGNIFLMRNHCWAYIFWKEKQAKDKILIHVDGHLDLARIDKINLNKILTADRRTLFNLSWSPFEMGKAGKILGIENFLYPAIKSGMVRQIWWVVPDEYLDKGSILKYQTFLKNILRSNPPELKLDRGVLKGSVYGIPLYISPLKDLPSFKEKVLLDIDTDYFTTDAGYSYRVKSPPRLKPEDLFKALRHKNIKPEIVTIAYSIEGGYTPLEYRYLGEVLLDLFLGLPLDRELLKYKISAHNYYARRNYGRAAAFFQRAKLLAGQDPAIDYGLSLSYAGLGLMPKALFYYQKAIEIDPAYKDALLYQAGTYLINDPYKQGIQLFKEYANSLAPAAYLAYANLQLGLLYEGMGKIDDAVGYYQKARGIDPKLRAVYNNLGNCYAKMGRLDDAIAEYAKAIEIDPDVAIIYYNLGNSYVKKGLYDLAIGAYRRLLEIDPEFPGAADNLNYAQNLKAGQ